MNSILIIEDDGAGAEIASRMCGAAGFRPSEFKIVNNLPEGLRSAIEEPAPDLILLDLVVPPISEAECIRDWVPLFARRAPVVMWTGSVTADVVMQCHQAGAMSCLLKQVILFEKCGLERMTQAITDAILNWRREHAAAIP